MSKAQDRQRLKANEREQDRLRRLRAKHAEAAVAADHIMRRHLNENRVIAARLDVLWNEAAKIRARLFGERMEPRGR